jgi:aspartate/methionine/tyrosine aminotransferase
VAYTSALGLPALRDAIAAHYQIRYGVPLPPHRIIVTPGASGAFLIALGLIMSPGTRMLLPDPGYPCYANLVSLFSGNSVLIPVDATSRFQLDTDRLLRHWDRDTVGTILTSPANPTGTTIDPAVLADVIAAVGARNGFFVADEIYHGLEYERVSPTALNFSPDVFVVNSFSKYFGMTGWRIGWVIVPERFTRAAEILAQNLFIAAPTPSQYAALAALGSECGAELEQRRQAFGARRDFLVDRLRALGLAIPVVPEGAFYVYADVSAHTDDSFEFARRLLEEQGVAVTPGKDFGRHRHERFVRFAYTTSIDRMAEAVGRIRSFL